MHYKSLASAADCNFKAISSSQCEFDLKKKTYIDFTDSY